MPSQYKYSERNLLRVMTSANSPESRSIGICRSHITRQSRPDVNAIARIIVRTHGVQVYPQVVGDPYGVFDVSAGLLLESTYHMAHDALM